IVSVGTFVHKSAPSEKSRGAMALFLGKRTGLVRRGEVLGNRQCHLARCRPFGTTQYRRDESDAPNRSEIVAHRGVNHTTLAIADGPDHRLMLPRSALRLVRPGC